MERMGRQRAVESSTVLDQASEKVTSTRSRHEERFLKLLRSKGLLMAGFVLPHNYLTNVG